MLGVSSSFIIFKNKIINKKTNKTYTLPDSLIKYIYSLENIDYIPKELLEFLKKEDILIKLEKENLYNPFLKETNMNNQRLFIQLTQNCNLYCRHCFIDGKMGYNDWFDIEKVKLLVDKAVEYGIYRIDFTGGEISILPWLGDLIKYLDSKPIIYSLFSNLTIKNENLIKEIENAKGLREVITSLDYFDNNKHDLFRGRKGSYELTMKNIKKLHDKKINISVNTMILDDNHDDIIKMIDYFYPHGIYMCLDTIVKKGRAESDLFFTENYKEDMDFIIKCIKYIKKKYNYDIDLKRTTECGIGSSLIYVDKNGRFQLCPGLTEKENKKFFIGESIDEAIRRRENFDLECKEDCKHKDVCSYGCREKAFNRYGKVDAKEICLCYLMNRGF